MGWGAPNFMYEQHEQTGDIMSDVFKYTTRVYYEQTDAGGVMYHSNYISVIEHARMEFWIANGYHPAKGQQEDNMAFVVADCSMHWIKPAVLSDMIEVTVKATGAKRVSMDFEHEIYRIEDNGERTLLNTAKLTLVCMDLNTMRACNIPEAMKENFLHR